MWVMSMAAGMANVCSVPLAWIFFRGQGVKSYSLISKAARADGYLIPTRSRVSGPLEEGGYEGAIVLDPQEGIHMEPVAVMDYSSLYPSCMCSENISHDMIELDPKYDNLPGVEYVDISYDTSDGVRTCRFAQSQQGIIPKILTHLIKQRKAARSKIPQAKDAFAAAVLEGLQLAYKLTSNSIYGQMGAVTSPVFMKDIAACTTATGRRMLLKAKAYMEDNYGANVIYGDTGNHKCGATVCWLRLGSVLTEMFMCFCRLHLLHICQQRPQHRREADRKSSTTGIHPHRCGGNHCLCKGAEATSQPAVREAPVAADPAV